MGNSPKKIQSTASPESTDFAQTWSTKNIIRHPLNHSLSIADIIQMDMISLDAEQSLVAILTKRKIIFQRFIVRHNNKKKKKPKLDMKVILEMRETDATNLVIHPVLKTLVAITYKNRRTKILKLNIVTDKNNKSYQVTYHLVDSIDCSKFADDVEAIQNNLYFLGNTHIVYTSANGKLFIYNFDSKQLINSIHLTSIIERIHCIDYGYDSHTRQHFVILAKKSNPKELRTEMVYALNVSEFMHTASTSTRYTLHEKLLYLDEETNTFEAFSHCLQREENKCSLKLFKQIECVSFSPHMDLLAVACGSCIDFFCYKQQQFKYIGFHNYGGSVQKVAWLSAQCLIVVTCDTETFRCSSVLTQLVLDRQQHVVDILQEILENVGESREDGVDVTRENIVGIVVGFLQQWTMKHKQIANNCDDMKSHGLMLRSCMEANGGRGAMIIGRQLHPELLVSSV